MMKLRILSLIIICLAGGCISALSAKNVSYDSTFSDNLFEKQKETSQLSGFFITIYGGRYTDRHLGEKVLMLKPIYYEDSWLKSLALGKTVIDNSQHYRIEIESQFAKHVGEQSHYEINFLVAFRLQYFPLLDNFPFSFAFGSGISYATETPVIEERSRTNVNASKFLNYLLLEIASAIPGISNWELVGRIHHRSGVFGIYSNVRGGSNVMAAGLRYHF